MSRNCSRVCTKCNYIWQTARSSKKTCMYRFGGPKHVHLKAKHLASINNLCYLLFRVNVVYNTGFVFTGFLERYRFRALLTFQKGLVLFTCEWVFTVLILINWACHISRSGTSKEDCNLSLHNNAMQRHAMYSYIPQG